MISFIVPAHNEQVCLARTLPAIHEAARVIGQPYEIIVVDDASTDATAAVARQHQATVVSVNHRQIAATRNAGARAAHGERIFFVDADTTVNPRAIIVALQQMHQGAVGGGAPVWLPRNEIVPLYIWLVAVAALFGAKLLGFTGGAFMFCTRTAFQATGGFDENLYWSEENSFALALKREGRFFVVWPPVLTSGRRFRKTSAWQFLAGGVRMVFSPVKMVTRRASVERIWYDSNRTDDDVMPNSWSVKAGNAVALLLIVVLLTGPVWNFIPWSWTPRGTLAGDIRIVIGTSLCHVGLVFWPCAVVLAVNLVRQKRWTSLFQSVALIAFFVWQAWECTQGVIWFWSRLGRWLIG